MLRELGVPGLSLPAHGRPAGFLGIRVEFHPKLF